MLADLTVAFLMVVGAFFAAASSLGVVRMPDIFIRMHASTKAGTLGAGLILGAAALHFADASVTTRVVSVIAFLIITAPIGAHMIGRAAYRGGVPLWEASMVNEMPPPDSQDASSAPPPSPDGDAGGGGNDDPHRS